MENYNKEFISEIFEDIESIKIVAFPLDNDKNETLEFSIEHETWKSLKEIHEFDEIYSKEEKNISKRIFDYIEQKGCIVKVATSPEEISYLTMNITIWEGIKQKWIS